MGCRFAVAGQARLQHRRPLAVLGWNGRQNVALRAALPQVYRLQALQANTKIDGVKVGAAHKKMRPHLTTSE